MKRVIWILCANLFFVFQVHAQWKLVDTLTNVPIPAVSVFAADGKLLAITDHEGLFDLDQHDLNKDATVLFQHVSYTNKTVLAKDLLKDKVLALSARAILIPEVEVSAKQKDWLVLRGYFRGLKTFNGQHMHFYDGIINYYIPLATKEKKVKIALEGYRIFGNKEVLTAFKKVMGPFEEPPQISMLQKNTLDQRLPKGYEIRMDGARRVFVKDGVDVGDMKRLSNGRMQSYIDYVRPDSMKRRTFFRIEGIAKQQVYIENYYGDQLAEVSMSNLKSLYENSVGTIKRKKAYGKIPYELLYEFYVMERSYKSDADIKNSKVVLSKSVFLPHKSKFQKSYWLDLTDYAIPPIPEGLAKQLGQSLLLF